MLDTLRIQNFKSWQDTGTIQFGALTGFFGTNSSGKTSILQFLLMLKQTVESSDRARILNLGDENSYVELGTFNDIIFNHKQNSSLEFEIQYRIPQSIIFNKISADFFHKKYADPIKLRARIYSGKQFQSVEEFSYHLGSKSVGMRAKDTRQRDTTYQIFSEGVETRGAGTDLINNIGRLFPHKFFGFPTVLRHEFSDSDFLSDIEYSFQELLNPIYYLGPLRDYPKRRYLWGGEKVQGVGNRGENAVAALLASRQEGRTIYISDDHPLQTLEEYIAGWLHRLGLIESFQVQEVIPNLYELRVRKTAQSAEVFLTDVGFGVSQLLPVLVLLFYVPEGSTIILEQPEIHLHPAVQAGLADVMLDAIKRRNVQIILESHSEHLLQRLQTRLAEEVLPADKVKLYFTKFEQEASGMTALDLDEYGNIRNWPKNFFGDQFGEAAARMRAEIGHKQTEGKQ